MEKNPQKINRGGFFFFNGGRARRTRGGTRRLLHGLLLCSFLVPLLLLGSAKGGAASEPTPEEELLGLYLYNFLLFVDWPENSFRTRHTVEVGLLSENQGEGRLLAEIAGKLVRGRTLVIKRIRRPTEFDPRWQVLFIRDASREEIRDLLAGLKHTPCLTMSDIPGFADRGGMVEFIPSRSARPSDSESRTVDSPRFRINLDAVLQADLKIRSRLLRLSEIAGEIPNGIDDGR